MQLLRKMQLHHQLQILVSDIYIYFINYGSKIFKYVFHLGDIIWRQILEKGPDGSIELIHPTKSKIITVSGIDVIKVRGWDVKDGYLHFEWSKETNNVLYWFVFNGFLHNVYLSNDLIVVDTYYLETGVKGKTSYTFPANWFSGSNRY